MEATKAIASVPDGRCLCAFELLQYFCAISLKGDLYQVEDALMCFGPYIRSTSHKNTCNATGFQQINREYNIIAMLKALDSSTRLVIRPHKKRNCYSSFFCGWGREGFKKKSFLKVLLTCQI